MKPRIVASTWYTPSTANMIGAILVDSEEGLRGFIGTVTSIPHKSHEDEEMIERLGARLTAEVAAAMFPLHKSEIKKRYVRH